VHAFINTLSAGRGEDATNVFLASSTLAQGTNSLPAGGPGWCPPKALCGGSTPPRESTHAGEAHADVHLFGKENVSGPTPLTGTTSAPQALLAMRPACTREITGSIPVLGSNSNAA